MTELKHFDILAARKAYSEGQNITELLRRQKQVTGNTPEIIEAAYDLQAGTYIEHVEKHPEQTAAYTAELAELLDSHISSTGSLLDVGTGELTTLSLVTTKLTRKPRDIFAFDISWSRVFKGRGYAGRTLGNDYQRLTPFVGDISEIPLPAKSIDITTSSHALEPNGGRLKELLAELFRVTAGKVILFEPCYEINSEEGRQRMDRLGYIKDIGGVVEALNGKLVDRITIRNSTNPLNPTACFVIEPPPGDDSPADHQSGAAPVFSVPGTSQLLTKVDEFYFSNDTGLSFPVLKSIPVLKSNAAILASALCY